MRTEQEIRDHMRWLEQMHRDAPEGSEMRRKISDQYETLQWVLGEREMPSGVL